ncbi:MAG: hypothetical protein ACM3OH_12030 [Bacillota bacterium]|jgi:hypothetical protein
MTTLSVELEGGVPAAPEAVGPGWRTLALLLAVPACLIGIFAYPNVQLATMPLSVSLPILLAVAAGIVLAGRARLLILLPLISAFLPSPELGFVAYLVALGFFLLVYGGARLVRPLDALDWALLAVLLWTLMSWLVNLGDQTDLWSLPVFTLTFLAPWLLLFTARAAAWSPADLGAITVTYAALVTSQLAPAFLKPIVLRMPEAFSVPLIPLQVTKVALIRNFLAAGDASDMTSGTTPSAHHLGIALLLFAVFLVALNAASRRRVLVWLLAAVVFVFLMTDSKHVILSAVPAGLVFAAIVLWPALAARWRRVLTVAGVIVAVTVGPLLAVKAARILVDGLWRPYIVLAKINPKVQLVMRTGELLSHGSLDTWIGYGPGSYATRAATIRATDVLFKEAQRLPDFIPPYTSPAYRSVAYDLYTADIVATAQFRSGVLTNPFSSLIGIVGEYGIAGSAVVALFLWLLARAGFRRWRDEGADRRVRAAGATLGFAVPFLVCLGIFDSYFEQPDITAAIVTLALLALADGTGRWVTRSGAGGGTSGTGRTLPDPAAAPTTLSP